MSDQSTFVRGFRGSAPYLHAHRGRVFVAQHDAAVAQMPADGVGVDPPNFAGECKIDAVTDSQRARGDEVSRRHTNAGAVHGRVRETHG